ncbi:hypothetical protein T265_06926 [Opisthorchis viverrini]|uniref:Reverse transcriptase domain-containing protein n=1 Tax=Opisthorchis viverrini TaxID=6198 RepID=A0A074ZQM6_OPIVI|nr:hypothetical protein T265_06926 [Opisthorchis viverrini]KER25635.1 hypothetical protein T265_06926 [Opisthorchis viverrini]
MTTRGFKSVSIRSFQVFFTCQILQVQIIQRRTLDSLQNPSVRIVASESHISLEYADDIVLIFEDQSEAQALLNRLTITIPSFGMHLVPSKCKATLQNVQSANMSIRMQGESLGVAENFTYLGSCISTDGTVR